RVERSLRFRLADAYVRWERAKEAAESYRSQNLPDAKEAFELSVIGYRQGHGSWPQVLIAQQNYFRMSTEYIESLAELRRTELSILGLMMDAPEESQAPVRQAVHQTK
ncbi:MAG TPA: TolC family protein, partial [Gemmataceae bacterium]|nr:TolC family protein [Gemmataceae bacterium]